MFRNTLTANDKYPVRDCQNLPSIIKMNLSLNPKIFSDSFVQFLASKSNFQRFEGKDDRHSYFISEITDGQSLGYPTLSKKPFQNTLLHSTC